MHIGELAEELGEHDAAGPGRGTDLEGPVELAGRALLQLADDLVLEREKPLSAAVEAEPGLGRLDAPTRPVE